MKTDPVPATPGSFARHDARRARAPRLPCAVACYQPRRDGMPGGGGGFDGFDPRPGFNRLASEALRNDASRTFRVERAVLGVVTLVSAWPVASMIYEVFRLLK